MRVYRGGVFIGRKENGDEENGVYRLSLLESRETNTETANICQTHIFSDLSRPRFPKSQFNFSTVATIARFLRGKYVMFAASCGSLVKFPRKEHILHILK